MTTLQRCLVLTVLAWAMACSDGFSLSRQSLWWPSLDAIARQSRDIDTVNETMVVTSASPDACAQYFQCRSERIAFAHPFMMLDLTDISGTLLATDCQSLRGCVLSGCSHSHPRAAQHGVFSDRIASWVCDHQQGFLDGASCWEPPFRSRMRECAEDESGRDRAYHDVNVCFGEVARSLPSCSQEDAQFIHSFTTYILDTMMEVFPVNPP